MRRHSKRVQEREAMKALQSDKSPQSENNDSSESSDGSGSESSSDSDSDEERQKPADTGMESDTHDPNFLSEDELESKLKPAKITDSCLTPANRVAKRNIPITPMSRTSSILLSSSSI